MSEYTKGPWRQGGGFDGIIGILGPEDDNGRSKVVCDVFERDEQLSNASLIASAPDLLEALQGMMQVYGGIKWDTGALEIELQELARKAIAQALA